MNLEDEYRNRAPETLEACSTREVHRRVNPFAQPVQVLRAGSSLRSKAEAYLEKARRVSDLVKEAFALAPTVRAP